VLAGLTLRVAGLDATLFCTVPSDQVTFQGPVPVRTAWMVVLPPRQIVALPLTVAVGRGLTVTLVEEEAVQPLESVTVTV